MKGIAKIFFCAICFLFFISSIGPFGFNMNAEKWSSFRPGILENREGNDTQPPVTIITLNGTMGMNGWYISDVTITLNATDDMSGINATYYKLATENEWNKYEGPFIIKKDTYETLDYYSIDNAGNIEEKKECGLLIDRTSPTSSMLQRFVVDMKIVYRVVADDRTSGMNRVEFYLDGQLMYTDRNGSPYEWTSTGNGKQDAYALSYDYAGNVAWSFPRSIKTSVRGFILHPEYSSQCVRFFSIITISHDYYFPNLFLFKKVTFQNNWTGTINKYYIDAVFTDSQLPPVP